MVAEVFAGISAFGTMLNTAKTLREMDNAVSRNEAVIDLQGQILTAQENYTTLLGKVRDLETKLAAFENWETQKQRYELKEVKGFHTATVYVLKEGVQPPELPHSICPDCYESRQKRILQACHSGGAQGLTCNECGWIAWLQGHPPAHNPKRR